MSTWRTTQTRRRLLARVPKRDRPVCGVCGEPVFPGLAFCSRRCFWMYEKHGGTAAVGMTQLKSIPCLPARRTAPLLAPETGGRPHYPSRWISPPVYGLRNPSGLWEKRPLADVREASALEFLRDSRYIGKTRISRKRPGVGEILFVSSRDINNTHAPIPLSVCNSAPALSVCNSAHPSLPIWKLCLGARGGRRGGQRGTFASGGPGWWRGGGPGVNLPSGWRGGHRG